MQRGIIESGQVTSGTNKIDQKTLDSLFQTLSKFKKKKDQKDLKNNSLGPLDEVDEASLSSNHDYELPV